MNVSQVETIISNKYNRLASIYDLRWRNYLDRSFSFLLDFAEISPSASILDLACGTGELTRLILKTNPQQDITGIDISPAMLAIANNKLEAYPQAKLSIASATELPFARQSFDLVICANAFHYLESPELTLAEIKRVLKPKGTIVILDWCRDYFILKIGDRLFNFIDPAYRKCYTKGELESLLLTAGFKIVKDNKMRFSLIWELIAVAAIVGT